MGRNMSLSTTNSGLRGRGLFKTIGASVRGTGNRIAYDRSLGTGRARPS